MLNSNLVSSYEPGGHRKCPLGWSRTQRDTQVAFSFSTLKRLHCLGSLLQRAAILILTLLGSEKTVFLQKQLLQQLILSTRKGMESMNIHYVAR